MTKPTPQQCISETAQFMRDLELVLSNKPAARDQIDTLNTLLADMKVTVDSGNTGTNGDIKAKKIAATDHTLKTCRARQ